MQDYATSSHGVGRPGHDIRRHIVRPAQGSTGLSQAENGVSGKADLLKAMADDDPPAGPYVAGDYKVEFLDSNTAVMTHSVGSGGDRYWSMHVWRKNGGKWQVAATASIEADDD